MDLTRNILIDLGDALYATDNVSEENGIGFNKLDRPRWGEVRGNIQAMSCLLYKYRKQLANRFGQEKVNQIVWHFPENYKVADIADVKVVISGISVDFVPVEGGYLSTLSGRLDKERFGAYLAACRGTGGRFNGSGWIMPPDADYEAFDAAMAAIKVTVRNLPTTVESPKPANAVQVKLRDSGEIAIYHPYSPKMNEAYRSAEQTSGIIGFDWADKCRLVGANCFDDLQEVLTVLRTHHPEWHIDFAFDYESWATKLQTDKTARRTATAAQMSVIRPEITPLPYQVEGLNYYEQMNGKALNGDDMGLGKTFQTLWWAALNKAKVFVVCPKNVRRQWLQEANKFFVDGTFNGLELDAQSDPTMTITDHNLVTVNYEILYRFQDLIARSGFNLLVIDESHRIKNPRAGITREIFAVQKYFQHYILLSGTPIKNKKDEIRTQAQLIDENIFEGQGAAAMGTYYGCKEHIKKIFFRRTKKAELKNLPDKIRGIVSLPVENAPDWSDGMQIGELSALKSHLARTKAPVTISYVKDILSGSDSKVIVFSDSDDAAAEIQKGLGSQAVLHVGSTPHEKREAAKAAFCDPESDVRVFVATTGTAREGLNLTVADKVVFNDLPWTPADLNQAEDRAYRIGQKNCVNVYWIQADGNWFDGHIVKILFAKMAVYDMIINGVKPTGDQDAMLKVSLFKELQSAIDTKTSHVA